MVIYQHTRTDYLSTNNLADCNSIRVKSIDEADASKWFVKFTGYLPGETVNGHNSIRTELTVAKLEEEVIFNGYE